MAILPFSFVSMEETIDFSQNAATKEVEARLNGRIVNVSFPYSSNLIGKTHLQKFQALIRNALVMPRYHADKDTICFDPIAPKHRNWTLFKQYSTSPAEKWISRLDGTISFAIGPTIKTWNWLTEQTLMYSYTHQITALAESVDGTLLLGGEKGFLWKEFEKCALFQIESQNNIDKIEVISETDYLIFSPDSGYVVFNIKKKTIIKIDLDKYRFFQIVDGIIYAVDYGADTKESILLYWWSAANSYERKSLTQDAKRTKEDVSGSVEEILAQLDSTCYCLVNLRTKEITKIKTQIWDGIYLGNKWIAYPESSSIKIFKLNGAEKEKSSTPIDWGKISTTTLLSDGSIMYSRGLTSQYNNNLRAGTVNVISQEAEELFSSKEGEWIENYKGIDEIIELVDGCILLKDKKNSQLYILKSNIISQEISRIAELKLKIQHDPSELDRYQELVKLLSSDDEKMKYLMVGMQQALKAQQFYLARQFYRNGKKIKSDDVNLKALKKQLSDLKKARLGSIAQKRLFVGEGDFSFTEAIVEKHPEAARTIKATELDYSREENKEIAQRIQKLREKDLEIYMGVDGTKLSQFFQGQQFNRIQWNCPFGYSHDREVFKKAIPDFFTSCAALQLSGDRVHVTLIQKDPAKSDDYWKIRQRENPIVLGSAAAGYRLIRKRNFGPDRYPGYKHVKTGTTDIYDKGGVAKEFVFEKTDKFATDRLDLKYAQNLQDPSQKKYEIKTDVEGADDLKSYYFECSTDEESSSGEFD